MVFDRGAVLMIDLLAIAMADPMSLPVWAVLAMSAAMYPLGFMFGVCSACCDQCRNDTCDGFDLEEAFSHRTLGPEYCRDDWIVEGANITAPLEYTGSQAFKKGMRVVGINIPEGTEVVEVEEVWSPPKTPLVAGAQRGCCDLEYRTIIRNFPGGPIVGYGEWQRFKPSFSVTIFGDMTEEQCDAATEPLYEYEQNGLIELRNVQWRACYGCKNSPEGYCVGPVVTGGNDPATIDFSEFLGIKITLSQAPTGQINCLTFGGQSGLCQPFPAFDEEFGPYGGCATADDYGEIPITEFGPDLSERRRMCIRYLCRCYQSTGNRGNEQFPDPEDWYTVVSTSEIIGGPTLNSRDLEADLEAATVEGMAAEAYSISQYAVGDFTTQPAGTKGCIVWTFVFYGRAREELFCDCVNPSRKIKTTAPNDDCFTIHPCLRCQ